MTRADKPGFSSISFLGPAFEDPFAERITKFDEIKLSCRLIVDLFLSSLRLFHIRYTIFVVSRWSRVTLGPRNFQRPALGGFFKKY